MSIFNPSRILALAACLFLLSACSTAQRLDHWAGELLLALDQPVAGSALPKDDNSQIRDFLAGAEIDHRELTRIEKKAIDDWLAANGYNRFGDRSGTAYPEGTPLIGQDGGAGINRFEYILQTLPDIMQKIKE